MAKSSPEPKALGLAIQLERESRRMSRTDLAEIADLSYPYIYEVEQGKKLPSDDAFVRISAALDMDPAEFTRRAERLAGERTLDDRQMTEPVTHPMALPPEAAVLPVTRPGMTADERVDRLTSAVIARIEPIVREAITAALDDQS